jgi:hypothetical protein
MPDDQRDRIAAVLAEHPGLRFTGTIWQCKGCDWTASDTYAPDSTNAHRDHQADMVAAALAAEPDDDTLRAARFVADHWRQSVLASPDDMTAPWRLAAHPLCMVLAALDGERDPAQLGIEPADHDAFRAVLDGPTRPADDPENAAPGRRGAPNTPDPAPEDPPEPQTATERCRS